MKSDREVYRAHVMADPAAQAFLDEATYPDDFAARAQQLARSAGLPLDHEALRASRRANAVAPDDAWAPEGWLPTAIVEDAQGAWIDWARFGARPLTESFYQDSVAHAAARPFNRLFRHGTRLDAFIDRAPLDASAPLKGMIFHMSRCGSTLVAQMLAALPAAISLSEPGPLDSAIRYVLRHPELPHARRIALLRAMMAALARSRSGESRCFLKLDSWHILALPLLRDAFPDVPWIYLFRDPVEVLVSQMRQRGYQTVPALVPPGLYDADTERTTQPEILCARIFAHYHAAAVEGLATSGIAIDYATLPAAFFDRIAPHFGLRLTAAEQRRIAQASAHDAKAPDNLFTADGARKRSEAGAAVTEAATRQLGDLHDQLLRISRSAPKDQRAASS
ncbi:sulfotransferase [Sphingosinithalassobacter sp. LHW66-3]|uniref:sulfotransferase n=1 Tax=Sphingosinithalassobacter sp. LHW66-3 TaxID=3424718 RepID=UPI003D6B799E